MNNVQRVVLTLEAQRQEILLEELRVRRNGSKNKRLQKLLDDMITETAIRIDQLREEGVS